MGAATGAMWCRSDSGETRCVTGKLELDRYQREGMSYPSKQSHNSAETGKLIVLKATLDLWTIASGFFLLVVILSRSKLRSNHANWLIINAVLVCLLNAILVDPILMDISNYPNPTDWRFGSLYCYMLFGGPADIFGAMVPVTLIMILIERLMYIRSSARKDHHISLKSTIAMIITPWAVMSVITVFIVYLFKNPRFNKEQCTLEVKDNVWTTLTFASWFSLSLALPICLMNLSAIVAIGSVCCVKIQTLSKDAVSDTKEKKTVRHAMLLITAVAVLFSVTGIPSAIAYITAHTATGEPLVSFEIVVILQMAFRAVEPIMWLLLSTELRSEVYEMMCGWRGENKTRNEQTRLIDVPIPITKTVE